MMAEKIVIYQLFPRLFSNEIRSGYPGGTIETNGCGKFNDIDEKTLISLQDLGITHIWLTGIIRHATGTKYPQNNLDASHPQILKGLAGSPYAIKDYFDIDPDLAEDVENRMGEFESLLNRIHQKGLKVIIDFIPNHVSRDYNSLQKSSEIKDLGENDINSVPFSPQNNFYYLPGRSLSLPIEYNGDPFIENPAKATGNDVFSPAPSINDWYETVKLNYGINYENGIKHFDPLPDTWIKMTQILNFWAAKGIDGFRCDMAGMVPVEFWSYSIGKIKEEFHNIIFIAELYEPEQYRNFIEIGGFDFLYDKVGLYDSLRGIILGHTNTDNLSTIWKNLDGFDRYMLRFMENHDEQRIASVHFAGDFFKGIPAMAVCALMNTGPVMIYNGQEVGEEAEGTAGFSGDDGRTSIFDYCSMPALQNWRNHGANDGKDLSADQRKLRDKYVDLLNFARKQPEIQGQFYDLMWQNQDLDPSVRNRIYAFLRFSQDSILLIVVSFDTGLKETRIRIPVHALDMAGLAYKESFHIQEVYPLDKSWNLIQSQLSGSGLQISFNHSGWTAIRLS